MNAEEGDEVRHAGVSSESAERRVLGFDAHCHLDFGELAPDLEGHLARARAAGIGRWHVPGCGPSQWGNLDALRDVPGVSLGLGVHPWWCHEVNDLDAAMSELERRWTSLGVVALGECGLDRVHERRGGTSVERQEEVFRVQLELARYKRVPVVLHIVGAHDRALRVLHDIPPVAGMVHGFTGAPDVAQRYLRLGLRIGIGFAVTSENSRRIRETAARLSVRDFVLETDAPDQAPRTAPGAGSEGKRYGVPVDWTEVARVVAELRREPPGTVVRETAENARQLFGAE